MAKIEVECYRCGAKAIISETETVKYLTCVSPNPNRTSGICGGGFIIKNNNNYDGNRM